MQKILEYPHKIIRAHIMLIGCGQHGVYQQNCHDCRLCHDKQSCQWVNDLEIELSKCCSTDKQLDLLEHALDCMKSYVRLLHHDVISCSCSNCQWIRNALTTYNELTLNKGKDKVVRNKPLRN